jgi:hypothetical protein
MKAPLPEGTSSGPSASGPNAAGANTTGGASTTNEDAPDNTSDSSTKAPSAGEHAAPSADPVVVLSPERRVADKLGLGHRLAIGLGNDAADLSDADKMHAYELSSKVDIHYLYLSGFEWPSWNSPPGAYITEHANAAKTRGMIPMFTLYQAAEAGDGNIAALDGVAFMKTYWSGVRIMFERLAELGSPAIVHLEPDLWGYAQKKGGNDPAAVPMQVASIVAECKDLPNDVSGVSRCMIRLARSLAPKVVLGLSASSFGAPEAASVGQYLLKLGAADTDIMVVETLDRDAGCFESATDPECQRKGTFYWDETNKTHPNFHDHLAWAKTIRDVTGRPLLWWQMPLGRPSASPGGTASHYRDNRVKYFFSHADEFAAAGGIGAVFGKGKANQTTVKTDGGQFASALADYLEAPTALR